MFRKGNRKYYSAILKVFLALVFLQLAGRYYATKVKQSKLQTGTQNRKKSSSPHIIFLDVTSEYSLIQFKQTVAAQGPKQRISMQVRGHP